MRPFRRSIEIVVVVCLLGLASGCASTAANKTLHSSQVSYVAVPGGTVTLGIDQEPTGCNPNSPQGNTWADNFILNAVLPSAYVIGADGVPTLNTNLLSSAYLVSLSPETVVYTLNPQAVWSDGAPISAADFIYQWEQERGITTSSALSPTPVTPTSTPTSTTNSTTTLPSSAGVVPVVGGYQDIQSITSGNNGKTVTVVFKEHFADWQMLFHEMLPVQVMKRVGWNPTCRTLSPTIDLSGGPFEISSIGSDGSVVLIPNPHWWGVRPNLDMLTIRSAQSNAQLSQWMRSGVVQVGVASSFSPSFLEQVSSTPFLSSAVDLSSSFLQLDFSTTSPVTANPLVRTAIALAVDRESLLVDQVGWADSNITTANSHFYVQGSSGYDSGTSISGPNAVVGAETTTSSTPSSTTTTTQVGAGGIVSFPNNSDIAQSSQMLQSLGYYRSPAGFWTQSNGAVLSLTFAFDSANAWASTTATQLAHQLTAGGFKVTLIGASDARATGMDLSTDKANIALLPVNTSPYGSEAEAWYTPLFGPAGKDGSMDWTNYDSATFNRLISKAAGEMNPVTAAPMYQAADNHLWTSMVALPLFALPSATVWSQRVAGVSSMPKGLSSLLDAVNWAVRVPMAPSETTSTLGG